MRNLRRGRRTLTRLAGPACVATFLLALVGAAPVATPLSAGASVPPGVDATTSWTVYHGSAQGGGVDPSGVSFNNATKAWESPVLDGPSFGEPLEATGRVFVATENNTIYALAANSGEVLWSDHVGTPMPYSYYGCGDVKPEVGITGTPVIDTARSEIFAVANEDVDGVPAHFLVGLNIYTGAQELNVAVDPPGDDPGHLLQRTGLNLDDGNVVFGYGSYEGGCNPNHGWVASVPETGGTPNFYDTTGDAQGLPAAVGAEGSVWMGGAAPEVDADGNIWLGSGNSSPDTPYDGGDSVLELSPSLQLEQFFSPSDWSYQNANDQTSAQRPRRCSRTGRSSRSASRSLRTC